MLTQVIAEALAAQRVDDRDTGTAALALTYSRLMDDADELHAAAIEAVRLWDQEDPIGRAQAQRLADALAARQAVVDLGPKLLAALEALHMSPRARHAAKKAVTDGQQPNANPLDQLAAARSRKGRAETVDATAP